MRKAVILLGLMALAVYIGTRERGATDSGIESATYSLVQAVGNTERISATGLRKYECEARRDELAAVSGSLGAGGSVTCLPDNLR